MTSSGPPPPTPLDASGAFDPCPYGATPAGLPQIVGISLFSSSFWADFDLEPSRPFGSRLGELVRQPANQRTANDMAEAAKDALGWLINEGLAEEIDASATYTPPERIDLEVTVKRGSRTEVYVWADLWSTYV